MVKDIEMLLKLQNVDYELGELERSKSYLPEIVNNLEKEITNFANLLKETEEKLTHRNLDKKRLELDLETEQENLNKLQRRMREIKTNKEYDALTSEINTKKKKISETEDLILQAMDETEDLTARVSEYRQKLAEARKNNTSQLEVLKKQLSSIDTKIKIKLDERKNITVRIDKQTMAVYERVKKAKGASVVVSVRKRACGACYKSLPPQRIQEIRRGDGIICCDNCGRILVWGTESE